MTSRPTDRVVLGWGSAGWGAALIGVAGWIALLNLRLPSRDGWFFWVPVTAWLVTMGLLCWWAALGGRQPTARARLGGSWRMGWRLGAAGLALGFLGPLLITPSANLGPLLGILITGPAGFVLGALLGAASAGRDQKV